MKTRHVDVAIIGAGSAGLNARREAEKAGVDWVMIEAGEYGTTCARVGCMPSKLLIAAADAAHEVSRAGFFGVEVEPDSWKVNGVAVLERVRRERDRFVGGVVSMVAKIPEEHLLKGKARFIGPTTLMVDEHTKVEARSVIIATGSFPWIPPLLTPLGDRVMVNDDLFELRDLPKSMAIFGSGVIALELGQALDRLGVEVIFFNPFDSLGPFSDPAIIAEAKKVMGAALNLKLGVQVDSIEPWGAQGVHMRWHTAEGVSEEGHFEHILSAAGRHANIKGIGLEKTGAQLDARGLPKTDVCTTQIEDLPIFIAGDASGHRPLLHEASDEGRIAGANAITYPDINASVRRTFLAITFTDPQMGIIGTRYADLNHEETEIGEVSFENQGRSRTMGKNQGRVRIYARRCCCTIIGAEMFGPRVEHTAHLLAWAIQQKMRVQEVLSMPFYHPVIEEGIRTALRNLAHRLHISQQISPCDQGTSPGS